MNISAVNECISIAFAKTWTVGKMRVDCAMAKGLNPEYQLRQLQTHISVVCSKQCLLALSSGGTTIPSRQRRPQHSV